MRGSIGLFMNPSGVGSTTIGIGRTSKLLSCAFSSSTDGDGSGGGGGRGRGRGRASVFSFVGNDAENADSNEKSFPPAGRGHGRGTPLPSNPFLSSFNSFVASNPNAPTEQLGLGRGRGGPIQQSQEPARNEQPKRPIFLKKDDATGMNSEADFVDSVPRQPIGEKNLPENILTVLTGTGRGAPERKLFSRDIPKQENRHLRPRPAGASATGAGRGRGRVESSVARPKLGREEAVKKAIGVLSRAGEGDGQRRRRERFRGDRDDDDEGNSDDEDKLLGVGNDADGERLAKRLGASRMAELSEALDDMLEERVPEPGADGYIEAYDTNLKIELEPEYLMGDFETNPDIDEKPPIPLREALEKMKPFLMVYEGIESQEEWEEVLEDTMQSAPLIKEIVDHYSGPDRVTAKQQHEELERVAKTLPAGAPNSVQSFTNRAVLSLQSNPGWGFHRKCQFMDKLVDEVSKSYK